MGSQGGANSYEDIRKQRLLDNKQRFEDLGILKLSKCLSSDTKPEKKSQSRHIRPKPISVEMEPRRSSRERKPVPSYRDEVDIGLPSVRKRARFNSSWATYLARPIEEVKSATFEERNRAYKLAEKVQSNLESEDHPSFVKSMVRSHVYSCFWLGLPTRFCEVHLSKSTSNMVLENEEGTEYNAVFISDRTGLSGGWRAFALDHKLDDGDALVFQLVMPTRFKVYIVRAFDSQDDNPAVPEVEEMPKKVTKRGKRSEKEESKNLNSSKKEKSSEVSAVRRSLRNK